jgi:large subunit ribosomal protein L17
MFANLASSLIKHDRVETTLPKAKELRKIAEKLVTLGKKKTLHARRLALSITRDGDAVSRLFGELADRMGDRNGGYTRIYKLGFRHGDRAPMAAIEYLSSGHAEAAPETKAAHKPKAKPAHKTAKAEKPHAPEKKAKAAKEAAHKKAAPKKPAPRKTVKAKTRAKEK